MYLYFWFDHFLDSRAKFCLIFRSFFGQWSFKKNCFWDLPTFTFWQFSSTFGPFFRVCANALWFLILYSMTNYWRKKKFQTVVWYRTISSTTINNLTILFLLIWFWQFSTIFGLFLQGLYRGFTISCVGIFIYRGMYFGLYDSLKPILLGADASVLWSFLLGWGVTIFSGTYFLLFI